MDRAALISAVAERLREVNGGPFAMAQEEPGAGTFAMAAVDVVTEAIYALYAPVEPPVEIRRLLELP